MPSSRPSVSDRQDAIHGNTPLRYLSPAALASFVVTPIQATSVSVYSTDGITFSTGSAIGSCIRSLDHRGVGSRAPVGRVQIRGIG
jgi:hypothetical protein